LTRIEVRHRSYFKKKKTLCAGQSGRIFLYTPYAGITQQVQAVYNGLVILSACFRKLPHHSIVILLYRFSVTNASITSFLIQMGCIIEERPSFLPTNFKIMDAAIPLTSGFRTLPSSFSVLPSGIGTLPSLFWSLPSAY